MELGNPLALVSGFAGVTHQMMLNIKGNSRLFARPQRHLAWAALYYWTVQHVVFVVKYRRSDEFMLKKRMQNPAIRGDPLPSEYLTTIEAEKNLAATAAAIAS